MPPRDNDLQADARQILREDFGVTDELLQDEIIDEMDLGGCVYYAEQEPFKKNGE